MTAKKPASRRTPVYVTEPDAERLMLMTRYVCSRPDGEHLMELQAKIFSAEIRDPSEIPPDVVTMNSRVRVRFTESDSDEEFSLVFPSGANPKRKWISVLGSFGRALLGARVGDMVEFETGAGRKRCRILEILYQPERAGEYVG